MGDNPLMMNMSRRLLELRLSPRKTIPVGGVDIVDFLVMAANGGTASGRVMGLALGHIKPVGTWFRPAPPVGPR